MANSELHAGTVVDMNSQGLLVRLCDGRDIRTSLPRDRKFGCLFGSLVGWKVTISIRPAVKMARVIDISPPDSSQDGRI